MSNDTKGRSKQAPKTRRLELAITPGTTLDRAVADMAVAGLVANAGTVVRFAQPDHGELSLTDMVNSLRQQSEAAARGDLTELEKMLAAQAVALNAIFNELSRRAAINMGEYLEATERYLRLALRAQGQCRATLETLAVVKNPPVFARQANIAHGPQQVNVGTHAPASTASTRAYAHARENTTANELLGRA